MRSSVTIQECSLPSVAEIKQSVDDYISTLLKERMNTAANIHERYALAWRTISDVYSAGGKRQRPYLSTLSYMAYGGESAHAMLPAAAAQELLHMAMLIHDDIVDRDLVRHHTDNISGTYDKEYTRAIADQRERRHFADSAAMLAGDVLIAEACRQVLKCDVPKHYTIEAHEALCRAIFHVVGGELLDTEVSFLGDAGIDPLTVAEQKTASYSFVTPLLIGAILAGAPEAQHEYLKKLGTLVGIGFQLRDDIVGVFGDEVVTGKSSDGDIREAKQTLLTREFFARASSEQREMFGRAYGNADASAEQVADAKRVLRESGALEAVETEIDNYYEKSIALVGLLDIAEPYRDELCTLIVKSMHRSF